MAANWKPEHYGSVTPYLIVKDAAGLIDFLKTAFGAQEHFRMADPDGKVRHAEVQIGDSMVMIGGAEGEIKPVPACLYLYVPNVDEVYSKAVAAGAKSVREPADQFYGDRNSGVADSWGNQWWIGTHLEEVSSEEVTRRATSQT